MKTLSILLLILLPFAAFGQTHIVQKDTIVKVSADSISTQISRVDMLKFNDGTSMSTASTGSTITASDGVYMDGDTVKLGGNEIDTSIDLSLTDSSYFNIFSEGVNVSNVSELNVEPGRFFLSAGDGYNSAIIRIKPSGLIIESDTSLTEPNSAMTEAQVKREIAAASNLWTPVTGGIGYNGSIFPNSIKKWTNATDTFFSFKKIYANSRFFYINSIEAGSSVFCINQNIENSNVNKITTNSGKFLTITTNTSSGYGFVFNENAGNIFYAENKGVGKFLDLTHGGTGNAISIDVTQTGNPIVIQKDGIETYKIDSAGVVKFKGTYASIYRDESFGDTTVSVPNGSTPTIIGGFTTNSPSSVCVSDKANSRIVINKKGMYSGDFSLSYASGTNAVNWRGYLCGNGSKLPGIWSTGYTSTANDKRSTAKPGQFYVSSVPFYVDFRVSHGHASPVDLIIGTVSINVNYIGD